MARLPTPSSRSPVRVDVESLKNGTVPLTTLEAAFGPDSLGIILVSGLPGEYAALREQLLSMSSYLANLPAEELSKVERPEARYNVGWSCGKETLSNGQFDTYKGSYYVQPVRNAELEEKARTEFPDLLDMTSENVWPEEDILPGFRGAFEKLCLLIVDVAALVARSCDRYGEANLDGYRKGTLENIVKASVSTKARLLHYFPQEGHRRDDDTDSRVDMEDNWCGTHTDLGALTGLTSNMFVDEAAHLPRRHNGGDLPDLLEMDSHPDARAGLWIKDRSGQTTKVDIPRDCLAFQTGEALSLITRGTFKAVPHFVRGAKPGLTGSGKIARNTLAVFTQPNLWEVVDEARNLNFAELAKEIFAKTY